MGKPQPSMSDALEKHKRLRQQVDTGPSNGADLTVVSGAADGGTAGEAPQPDGSQSDLPLLAPDQDQPPTWVRHTLGLRSESSKALKAAAHRQKDKKIQGTLKPGEPVTEQEIADMAISWVLEQLTKKPA